MEKIVLSLIIGIIAGILDIIPMLLQKLDRYSIISALVQWIVAAFVIVHIEFGIGGWLKGLIIAVLLAIPIVILVMKTDAKSSIPILIMSAILGSIVGFVAEKFVN